MAAAMTVLVGVGDVVRNDLPPIAGTNRTTNFAVLSSIFCIIIIIIIIIIISLNNQCYST